MKPCDPYRRKRAALSAAIAADELSPEYRARAVEKLIADFDEQRHFVQSEFLDTEVIRQMIAGTTAPQAARQILVDQFDAWLREHRKFRVITTAWALYAADHPSAPAPAGAL